MTFLQTFNFCFTEKKYDTILKEGGGDFPYSTLLLKNIFLTFALSYKKFISECLKCLFLVVWMLKEHSIWLFCKHYSSVTFKCSLNILKHVV